MRPIIPPFQDAGATGERIVAIFGALAKNGTGLTNMDANDTSKGRILRENVDNLTCVPNTSFRSAFVNCTFG